MADKKPDQSAQSGENPELVKKIDDMMNLDRAPVVSKPDKPKSDVAEVAATVNKSLSKDMGTAPELPAEAKPVEEPKPEPKPEPAKPAEEPIVQPLKDPDDAEPADKFDDQVTDKAVDDIAAKESDALLAAEDAKRARKARAANQPSWQDKLRDFFKSRKVWYVVAALVVLILALPMTRYKVLGLAIKKSVTVTVLDSSTATPVSNADVDLGGTTVKTDANGKAKVRAGVGKHTLSITKKYYQDLKTPYFVGFKASSKAVKLIATGRLVPVTVTNKVTGQPVAGAQIKVSGTTAKTDAKGQATIALPTKNSTEKASLSLKGYNDSDIVITVTDKKDKANSFELTPAGQVYFLSNRSGSLDVVKTNLDGTGRKTVFEGTGREDPRTTSLLASRDWRYLVLKSRRDGTLSSLYLIDTATDKVTQFDNNDADFTLIGWYDHNFVYSLTRNSLNYWQAGRQAIKSYDADHLQLNQLDQNQAEGDSSSYAYQSFYSFYILDGVVVYNTDWNKQGVNSGSLDLTGKNDTIRAVQPNGQNKKDYQSFATTDVNYTQANLYLPQAVYYAVYDTSGKPTYYQFQNQSVKTANITQDAIDQSYPTFLLSPSGKQTLWTELRDGKNTLFTGDDNAGSKKQLVSASDYSPYGWYSDSYILLSKSSSELYIAGPGSLASGRAPVKITDYYKPAQNYSGYGYGYGGL
jgi:hypothetical protein